MLLDSNVQVNTTDKTSVHAGKAQGSWKKEGAFGRTEGPE